MKDTKMRILDTAEQLFAENGFAATSLRSIIAAAGVNLAAVHYHFHSKEELLDAVIRRRVEPVNEERLRLLEEADIAAGGQSPSLEAILHALVDPPMRLRQDPDSANFVRLMGRILAESDAALIRKHFGVTIQRFVPAIIDALPDVPKPELLLRLHFITGAMAHTLCGRTAIFGDVAEATTERIVAFMAGGLRAPVAATRSLS